MNLSHRSFDKYKKKSKKHRPYWNFGFKVLEADSIAMQPMGSDQCVLYVIHDMRSLIQDVYSGSQVVTSAPLVN
jgi:hypothetical protein